MIIIPAYITLYFSCSPRTVEPLKADIEHFTGSVPTVVFHNQYRSWAYVISVRDGDTITVLFQSGVNNWQIWDTRLLDIDAPEIRGKEKELGLVTRNWLADRILGQWILIDTPKWDLDKFGRLLIQANQPNDSNIEAPLNLNQEMLRLGLVKPYTLSQILNESQP